MDVVSTPEVSVIVPARNEEECLADCLNTLVKQSGVLYEIIVVDDHSSDRTRAVAEGFPVRVVTADPLPTGWSGKCNAAWSGARIATGKWLLFTDADTRHAPNSVLQGLREAEEHSADLLSYSPKQELGSLAERALMPVIFAELAANYPPRDVCDPNSPVAAANGQYLLVRHSVYDAVRGHAAVAGAILEDVELAKLVKRVGYRLRFRMSDVVSTRMYRSFQQMLEGWTKNLALLFPHAPSLAATRTIEFLVIVGGGFVALAAWLEGKRTVAAAVGALAMYAGFFFARRIRRAHFDWSSNAAALFGLPLFAVLLLNSDISHKRGLVRWKGREYLSERN